MKERIGIYICHCGGNISDYVDVEEIARMLKEESGVVISRDVMFACADSNQKAMVNDIQEHKLDAIVVASCSPKLHLHTFKNVADRAGLNPSNYVQVNIREQCSWPHSDQPQEANVKAVGLIRAGIRRVSHSESLENIKIETRRSVLIVGAGIAGMRAALDLAKQGNEVYLIEQDHFVGGRIAQNGELFMGGQNGRDIIRNLYNELKNESKVTLFTGASIQKVSGSLGNFMVDIALRPRYVNWKKEGCDIGAAINECPVDVPDEFNFGLTRRKAVYKKYEGALPDIPVADAEALKDQTEYLQKFAGCIDLTQREETISLVAGSVLVTTGYDPYIPAESEFGYQTVPNVVTLPEFRRMTELQQGKLEYNGRAVKSISYIYCVGSRQKKGENKYCSRSCCSSAIHSSLLTGEKFPGIKSYHIFRDIRTYGKQEILYQKSSAQGDIYIRYDEKDPPVVEALGNMALIRVKDYLTAKTELEIESDLVVLVTGMVSRHNSGEIAEKFKIPVGNDRFFNEIHPKLKPVETVIKGVFIGGSCQGPKNVSESVQSSMSAAAKVNSLIKSGYITLDPVIARINTDACTWCGKCFAVCEYNAIRKVESGGREVAEVNEATCKGCGICTPVCPFDAIEIVQYTNAEIEGMIDGFMETVELKESGMAAQEEPDEESVVMKEYPEIWKKILNSINGSKKSIPEICRDTGEPGQKVTYHLMTMNKYGIVKPDGMDAKEEYYYYVKKS